MIKTTVLQFMFGSTLQVHNPLICFLLANCYRINQCNVFIGQYTIKMKGLLLNVVHFQPPKHITKESDWFHNHSTQLTMRKSSTCNADSTFD